MALLSLKVNSFQWTVISKRPVRPCMGFRSRCRRMSMQIKN